MDDNARQQVGQQIRDARARKGWSIETLATTAGVSPNTVTSMERGGNVQPGKLRAVLDALGIEPLATTVARAGYPQDIEIVRDVIGMWLLDMAPEARAANLRDLLKFIVGNAHNGNGADV